MAGTNNLKTTVNALFEGMESVVSSKTVVGQSVTVGDTTLIPLVDISFGIGASAADADKKDKGMGGMGGKITPSAVLVIKDGMTRLIHVKNPDTITKILEMVPDWINKITEKKEDKITEEDVEEILKEVEEE